MNRISKRGLIAAALCLPTVAFAETAAPWIHVQVNEARDGGTKVNVNLPLSLIDVALAMVKDEKLSSGRIQLGHSEVSIADIRKLWSELKQAGDAELVRVEEKNDTVQVDRKGDRVQVRIGDKESGREKVRVDVPTSVVDALLAGQGNELDLKGAIAELQRTTRGDFINVEDGDSKIRIWIDDRPGS